MARPSPANPLGYVVRREYSNNVLIRKLLLRERLNSASNLYRKDLLAHYGCVNAIEFSNKGELLVSGGDDRRVLIWNVEQAVHGVCKPAAMRAQHTSNIFCLGFDSINSKVFSAGNDDQVIVHDTLTGDPVDYFLHEQPVYSLSIDPLNDSVFASACDDGRILIYDIREPVSTEPFCLASYSSSFHGVMFNPVEPRLVTTANSKEGVGLWDVRKPREVLMRYGDPSVSQSCMSVRFNRRGTHVLALRRRLPPVVYPVQSSTHLCQFDHPGYYNSCTMKSCCFAGDDDQYVLSGSDDFNLYVWRIPPGDEEEQWVGFAHMILRGHRSIVNQVRFNLSNYIVASSGVEKLIKFWSPFPLPDSTGSLVKECEPSDNQRKVFTHEEYIGLVLQSGQFMTHDYSHQSTKEDPRMMAFFDSLVQREIEGWTSEGTLSSEHSRPSTDSELENRDLVVARPSYLETNFDAQSTSASEQNLETSTEAQPLEAQNRISQLIARKRAQLMRLARSQTAEETLQPFCVTRRKRGSRIISQSSDSSESGREVTLSERADVENNNVQARDESDIVYQNGVASTSSSKNSRKNESKSNRKRRLKYLHPPPDSSEDDNVEDDNRNEGNGSDREWKPVQKRRKLWNYWRPKHSDSDNVAEDSEDESSSKVVGNTSRYKAVTNRRCPISSDSDEDNFSKVGDKPKTQRKSRAKLLVVHSSESDDDVGTQPKFKRTAWKRNQNTSILSELANELADSRSNDDDSGKVPNGAFVPLKIDCDDELQQVEVSLSTTPNSKQPYMTQELETPDSGIALSGSPYSQPSNSSGSQPSSPCLQPGSSKVCFQINTKNRGKNSGSSNRSWVSQSQSTEDSNRRNGYDWTIFQRFKNRVERTRRNFRKHMGDSDSN
ncbi:DDB1- and CUL4-associated factor 5 [Anabrus simplex]|uniref:DDB1- and CUL4-associated factor 5 n=1 Tax=Anabrus simplex TaxID=316456 RepID=UPI0034DD9080